MKANGREISWKCFPQNPKTENIWTILKKVNHLTENSGIPDNKIEWNENLGLLREVVPFFPGNFGKPENYCSIRYVDFSKL